ncbi:hypothetical protein TPAR_01533 [Tolypocladium paradoxum]|uniref:Uncharacterized protein n=1 Tax=Tolypocladium paradoxum TaxID=94208 RepID=A0A2S4L751_9HYPO|nr:hypothetical protein TPAR_01533 [Tolypocladium paradoxum]
MSIRHSSLPRTSTAESRISNMAPRTSVVGARPRDAVQSADEGAVWVPEYQPCLMLEVNSHNMNDFTQETWIRTGRDIALRSSRQTRR